MRDNAEDAKEKCGAPGCWLKGRPVLKEAPSGHTFAHLPPLIDEPANDAAPHDQIGKQAEQAVLREHVQVGVVGVAQRLLPARQPDLWIDGSIVFLARYQTRVTVPTSAARRSNGRGAR